MIAKQKLKEYDASFFANKFPKSEVWRLYETFKHDAIFLDIETSGYYGDITVLGIYDGYDTKIMIKGKNLDNRLFTKVLLNKKLLITFNGFSFDVPMIKRYFQKSIPSLFQLPHFDLRFACARIGLNGGLKLIEQKLGIKRLDQVKSMRGGDAINLWHKYSSTGNSDYLEQLVKYNEEDIINLKPLAELVVKNLKRNYDNFFVKF
ncbi:exonuclease [Candidatus Woesearchaeota archaeon]|nr:exonuclease [Candidatus Woesearchaeota archaeon]